MKVGAAKTTAAYAGLGLAGTGGYKYIKGKRDNKKD